MNRLFVAAVVYVVLAVIGWYNIRNERKEFKALDWSDELLVLSISAWIGPVYGINQIWKWIERSFDK